MAKKKTTTDTPDGQPFFFPEHGLTIFAEDREAAEKQLESKLKQVKAGDEVTE